MSDKNDEVSVNDEDAGLEFGYNASSHVANHQPEPDPANEPEPAPTDQATNTETSDTPPPNAADTAAAPKKEGEQQPPSQPPQNPAASGEEQLVNRIVNLVEGRLRNHTGHVNKILEEKLKALTPSTTAAATAAAKEQGADTPTTKQINDALKDGEKFKQLEKDFPEWAEALLEAQSTAATKLKEELLKSIPQPQIDLSGYVKADALTSIHETLVTITYPNWQQDIKTPEFAFFLSTAPDDIKALAESENAADAIKLMKTYYAARQAAQATSDSSSATPPPPPPPKPDHQSRLAAAVVPSTTSSRPAPRVMSEDEALEFGFKHSG